MRGSHQERPQVLTKFGCHYVMPLMATTDDCFPFYSAAESLGGVRVESVGANRGVRGGLISASLGGYGYGCGMWCFPASKKMAAGFAKAFGDTEPLPVVTRAAINDLLNQFNWSTRQFTARSWFTKIGPVVRNGREVYRTAKRS